MKINNRACSICQENHMRGSIINPCPVLYNGVCFVEQANLKIDKKNRFNYYPSAAFDTIKESFPELDFINNNGTTKVYIKKFNRWFNFIQNFTDQYYIGL